MRKLNEKYNYNSAYTINTPHKWHGRLVADWDLTELGVEQARRIGKRLSVEICDRQYVMYSSDLLCAKYTAEIIASYLSITQ